MVCDSKIQPEPPADSKQSRADQHWQREEMPPLYGSVPFLPVVGARNTPCHTDVMPGCGLCGNSGGGERPGRAMGSGGEEAGQLRACRLSNFAGQRQRGWGAKKGVGSMGVLFMSG